jgi:hypothetical protein
MYQKNSTFNPEITTVPDEITAMMSTKFALINVVHFPSLSNKLLPHTHCTSDVDPVDAVVLSPAHKMGSVAPRGQYALMGHFVHTPSTPKYPATQIQSEMDFDESVRVMLLDRQIVQVPLMPYDPTAHGVSAPSTPRTATVVSKISA